MAQKICKKEIDHYATLLRLEIRDALDLSPKVVFKGSELCTDPTDAAAPMSLRNSLRPIMATGLCGRTGALAGRPLLTPLGTPLGAVWTGRGPGMEAPPDPPRGSLCLSQGLTSLLTKMGGLDPEILK